MKTFYEIVYSHFRAPWDIGPRRELVELVESGRIKPCKAIDLGSGTASNCIFLAQHGFQVAGVDFASAAVELGKERAAEAGVMVDFIQDDLTDLKNVSGSFDLLVDYGTLDDLHPSQRDLYLQNVLPLTHPGSLFVLYCFEWQPLGWEHLVYDRLALRYSMSVISRYASDFPRNLSKTLTLNQSCKCWSGLLIDLQDSTLNTKLSY